MSSYAVFLRGVNVGGVTIKMTDLKQALASRPFSKVKTLLASGNVVLASGLSSAGVKKEFEACLREAFGYDAWVVVLPADRVGDLVAACPYPADDASTHTYLTLGSDSGVLAELLEAGRALDGAQVTALGPEALAWLAPAGGTLDSPFSKLSSKPKYKASTTTRNLRTMIKVRDAAAAL
ncbi:MULTISPECIES: DUF1697 domain-containing protein [unclassified Arthrobacter]|uniref:DUF1697 domain-containing protein n=1 Tax=unclassified Arthrobacter TaxID=235627 RepID=UPI002E03D0A4|nr:MULTISPECIES: DUF1697 domain-containing protein [unclassified Arthrobacter]MEC5192965.1 uncharacterized protein (DUF1697 family) [Arthrobacter sp. MP_M4]MEC5204527.1 uncharacterized protein (DUF1697 family) [Arthrobacter sp. MP_M7]